MIDKIQSLSFEIIKIVRDKGTEPPNTGKYNITDKKGSYICRRCGLALFRSTDKFLSSCGWPSFDDEVEKALKREPDRDGRRTEILCSRCDSHLGHVFTGEQYTGKNLRHCVNSLAIDFVHNTRVLDSDEIILAGGCFWGVEYYLKQVPGVLLVESGYIGGDDDEPDYESVCTGKTGHYEAVRVVYDPKQASIQGLLSVFFEIHDPTQADGQGPDIGSQYKSAVFFYTEQQKSVAQQLIDILKQKGFDIQTKILPVSTFWPAEDYHQDYYAKTGKVPYCHKRETIFD